MKKVNSLFLATMLFSSASISNANEPQAAPSGVVPNRPAVIVIGASDASGNWPYSTVGTTGKESARSRAAILRGYTGLCGTLPRILGSSYNVICKAVGGAMTTDVDFPWKGLTLHAPGYMTQFLQGLKEARSEDGVSLAKWLVITPPNDGDLVSAARNIRTVVTKAKNVGIKTIVQALPHWTSVNFSYQYDTALALHGQYYGSLIRLFGLNALPQASYETGVAYYESQFVGYPGVVSVLDFSAGKTAAITIDGVHLGYSAMLGAARSVAAVISAQ